MASKKNRRNQKGRVEEGQYITIPHRVLDCENFGSLGGWDVRLLVDLVRQFNGSNNGDLAAVWSMLKGRGWNSKGTLAKALDNLERFGFIEKTRQGGRHKCSLYALTWRAVDECKGKLDVMPTSKPSGLWKLPPQN